MTFAPFLTMVSPWMDNGTVLDYLKRQRSSQSLVNRLVRILFGKPIKRHYLIPLQLVEIAQGLSYLHSQDVVHGDLRGANILVDRQGRAQLADFGLSIVFSTSASLRTLNTNGGNGRWMAPELLDPDIIESIGFNRTPQSDVYSFACVCLEVRPRNFLYIIHLLTSVLQMHTRRAPFYHLTHDTSVCLKVTQGNRPPRPNEADCWGIKLSDSLWELMGRCWTAQPTKRPSLDLVVAELKNGQNSQEKPKKSSLTDFELYKSQAAAQEVDVQRLTVERQKAVQEGRVWDAFVLKVQIAEATSRKDELLTAADNAFWCGKHCYNHSSSRNSGTLT
jgi:serine/threonine protein kinase